MDFEEYIRQGEPEAGEKASAWQAAIGLQAVDGLKTSDYLKETARRRIEGEIDIDEAQQLIIPREILPQPPDGREKRTQEPAYGCQPS
jgi:hypothetical protein